MKVLHVMLSSGNGGAERFFEGLCKSLSLRGVVQVVVIHKNSNRANRLKSYGCDVFEINAKGINRFLVAGKIKKICLKEKVSCMLGWMSRGTAALPRIEGVSRIGRVGGFYKSKYFSNCDAIIVNTPDLKKYLITKGLGDKKFAVIPNFKIINSAKTGKLKSKFQLHPRSEKTVIHPGRLDKSKGFDISLKVISTLSNVRLLIAGEGPLRNQLIEQARKLRVIQRVDFLGWVDDIDSIFRKADACLFPTRNEPFGNVILDCWMNEVPIVTTNFGGPKWLIKNGFNGFLCERDDVSEFCTKLNRILYDSTLSQSIINNGLMTLNEKFSEDAVSSMYMNLFNEYS